MKDYKEQFESLGDLKKRFEKKINFVDSAASIFLEVDISCTLSPPRRMSVRDQWERCRDASGGLYGLGKRR